MLSILSKNITARNIQKALSIATGSEVKNRNTIRQATATAAGFKSFEQAQALCSRSDRIWDSLWVEREANHLNRLTVKALNTTLIFSQDTVVNKNYILIYKDSQNLGGFELPKDFNNYHFQENEIQYDHKNKKISMRLRQENSFVILKRFYNSIEIDIIVKGKKINTHTLPLNISDFESVDVWLNDPIQTPRLLAECAMVCGNCEVVKKQAESFGFNEDDFNAAVDTALWLFEKNKEFNDEEWINEMEPKRKFKQAMGFFAHLYLEYYYSNNREAIEELCQSTDFDEDMFLDSCQRAKAEAEWFLFSYC